MRFSQRIGKTPFETALQFESINNKLKNRLWNIILDYFELFDDVSLSFGLKSDRDKILLFIWKDFFAHPSDTIYKNPFGNIDTVKIIAHIRRWFFDEAHWYEIYDFVEFIISSELTVLNKAVFTSNFNDALKKEASAYKIINNVVTPIASDIEVDSIQEILSETNGWQSINEHLKTALKFLSDRESPDYRNSIKESISAVEATCIKITSDSKATLGKALTEIEKKHSIDGGLKSALKSIYGYTSNTGGIRHALIDDDVSPSFEDAKFMLVSCSAFVNYLKAKV
ncbi:AbiJ-NTD4 domain-containing protein [Flavobacterium litorale]|uniref:HEPN AbiJ-N-terminal domain-containing protein n=1 Tax=Flavobacterium litorale TaxID=2856519 RepID=A0ABX8VE61_9FLAO|nr:hypothetical protein [Flavobacterium litorale]QYJ68921.1 hypothetical protein K1I41_03285 [Flavobacterium litorale]